MQKHNAILLAFVAVGALVFWVLTSREAPAPTAAAPAPTAASPSPQVAATLAPTAPSAAPAPAVSATTPQTEAAPPQPTPSKPIDAGEPAQAGEVGLFFTSNTLGELIDCGCRQNPLGGLARRVKWINDRGARYGGKVVVDTGGMLVADAGAATESREQQEARWEVYMEALAATGAQAVNVGAHELALPRATLQAAADRHKVPLLSANLRTADGSAAFQESALIDVAGLKVGILGLVTANIPAKDRLLSAAGLQVVDPVTTAARIAKELKAKGAQLVVVAGQLRQDEIDGIGDKAPEVDLVLGSWEMDLTQRPAFLGRGYHIDPYHKGKWIGEVRLRRATRGESDRWFVPDLRDKLSYEQGSLQRQIAYYTEQFQKDDAPGAVKAMTAQERKFAEERMVSLRAKLVRVNMEFQGPIDQPEGGAALLVELVPVKTDLPEDAKTKAVVDAHHVKWPPPAVRH